MTRRQIFVRGMIAGILVGLVAQAVNWLHSAHPDASDFRRLAVIIQAVLSAIGALWLARGIPGEPDMSAPNASGFAGHGKDHHALNEGRANDAAQGQGAISASPIPAGRER